MLKSVDSLSTGMLYSDSCPGSTFPRSDFENLLKSLFKSGLIRVSEHSFEKEERVIHYKRAGLTEKGRSMNLNDIMSLEIISLSESIKHRDRRQTPKKQTYKRKTAGQSISGSSENPRLYETIREWRLRTAKKRGVPAFRIFTNQVLDNLARDLPTTNDELFMVHGVGPYFVQRYGREIIRMVEEYQQSRK
jgi:DNA topoisomerase-3